MWTWDNQGTASTQLCRTFVYSRESMDPDPSEKRYCPTRKTSLNKALELSPNRHFKRFFPPVGHYRPGASRFPGSNIHCFPNLLATIRRRCNTCDRTCCIEKPFLVWGLRRTLGKQCKSA